MKWPPYAKYKASGVEWLSDVPEDWVTWKATHGFRRIGSGTTPKSDNAEYYDDGDIPWVTTSELRETVILDTNTKVTIAAIRDYPTLRLYPVGTLLFAMYGATIGRLGVLGVAATVNQACAALAEPLQLDTWFVYYWLQMRRPTLIVLSAGGGQPNLSQDDLRQLRIPAPPQPDQRAIAHFLDRETVKIDNLVARKRTLIERLKEKRAALISRTVTRGLPPDAASVAGLDPHRKLKPFGIEWQSEVPESWSIMKVWLARVACDIQLQDGNHGELHPTAEDYVPDGIPFVMANDIVDGRVDLSSCRFIERQLADSLRIGFARENDVLLTHKGTVGRVGVVQPSGYPYMMLTPQVTYYRCLRNITSRFLYWSMQGAYWHDQMLLVSSLGTTRAYVGLLDQKRLTLLLPPKSEQIAIADYLDSEVTKIDLMITKVEDAIERLQEYRTALITAAVTGKIDVRGAVA